MAITNGIPLLQNSITFRIAAGPNYGARDYDLEQVLQSIQADLQNIVIYLATHQHAALNAVPSTGTLGASTASGAQLLSNAAVAPTTASPSTLFTQQ